MGNDPVPFWANLYLYGYEADFISNLIKTDKCRAIKFKKESCSIGYKCNLNYSGKLFKSFHVIYPNLL